MTTPRVTVPVEGAEVTITLKGKVSDTMPDRPGWFRVTGHKFIFSATGDDAAIQLSAAPAPEGGAGDDWRPIDSAPIGELVQVYWPCMALNEDGELTGEMLDREGHVSLSIRHSEKHGWEPDNVIEANGDWFGDDFEFGQPTHWKPRPSRPGAALATREEAPAEAKRCCDRTTIGPWCDACKEAPAEAGEAINWKAEYEALCCRVIKDREAIAKIIDPEAFVPMEDVIGMRKAFVKADAILALRAQPQARSGEGK